MEYENYYETVLKEIFIEDVFRIIWDYVLKPSNEIAKKLSNTCIFTISAFNPRLFNYLYLQPG